MTKQEYMNRLWKQIEFYLDRDPLRVTALTGDYDAKINLGWPHAVQNQVS
jgi:hypothetical protein